MFKNSIKMIYRLIFAFAIMLCWISTLHAITITPSASPAAVNKPVVFTIKLGGPGSCAAQVDYGDGTGIQPVAVPSLLNSTTFTITHTYTRKGLFTVTFNGLVCNALTPPSPVSISLRVTDFSIDRVELKFENNRPEITINKNEPTPGLYAKINYRGSGYLKGYWEVDGLPRKHVFKSLRVGPDTTIEYPKIPPLPTYTPGTHRVKFIITHPAMNITFPQAIYFVTNEEDISKHPIQLVLPEDQVKLPYEPVLFQWQPVKKADFYQVNLFSNSDKEMVYSAFTPKGEYQLKAKTVKSRMLAEQNYLWQVIGFNDQDKPVAQSKQRTFTFDPAVTFVPGNILLITQASQQGDQVVNSIKQTNNVQTLDQYQIKTLGFNAVLFYTPEDIFKIINSIKSLPGVVLAQPNFIYDFISEPLDDLQSINKMAHMEGFNTNLSGKGVSVAVVDSGVDLDHNDLREAIKSSANFISNTTYVPEIHGTGVAGLIGARINDFGIKGFAPGADLISLRACRQISQDSPQGECYSNAMTKALDTAIQQKAKIINMSLGARGDDKILSKLIFAGSEQGIFFVAPVGNRPGMDTLSFPASHPKVIAVAGLLNNGDYFPDQNTGNKADICVPCKNILTTTPGNNHNFLSGTSMSSAIVSGLLALSCEAYPEFNLNDFKQLNGDLSAWVKQISQPKDKPDIKE